MKENHFTYYKPSILTGLIVFLWVGVMAGLQHVGIPISALAVISVSVWLLNQFLWHKKPFSWLFWTEDFRGRYEGWLEYEYIDEGKKKKGKLKHIKIIHQSGSSIKVASFTYKKDGKELSSSSESNAIVVQKDEAGIFKLIYTYRNEGNTQLGYPPHYGTEVLKFVQSGKEKKLTGDYYTNRIPQTRGVFKELKHISNDLTHPTN